jgi:hypothetical protein
MSYIPQDASLQLLGLQNSTSIYQLRSDGLTNQYYVVSGDGTRHLMASPEVVGYESYLAMKPATTAVLQYFSEHGLACDVDILTILRGGLNYPLEECCYKAGIRVPNMNFISCERHIEDGIITGLDIKYEKLHIAKDITLMIGDIIASGDTLRLCLSQVIDRFRRRGGSLKQIIFFTIGGTKAIPLMERFTAEIRGYFPEFEGFRCVFYEGIFTVYEDKGVTGVNIPDIDFGWRGGFVAPEFRHYVLSFLEDALFEKCIIYDGGARRYEIPAHYEEVMDYWESLLAVAPQVDFQAFIAEKIGYSRPIDYDAWRVLNGYSELDVRGLFDLEQHYLDIVSKRTLQEICERRIREIRKDLGKYVKEP